MISFKTLLILIVFLLFIRYNIKDKRKKAKSYKLFYSSSQFPILKMFEKSWLSIRNEASNIQKNIYALQDFSNISNKIIQYNIIKENNFIIKNSQQLMVTTILLSRISGIRLAKFIVMKPFSISPIFKNIGNQKNNITYVLALDIPRDSSFKLYCYDQNMYHQNGTSYLFDSSYPFYFENQSHYSDAIIFYVDINLNFFNR
jgi:aspartyl/asparaginyl beta-hydroxylase (cupin superfamily)